VALGKVKGMSWNGWGEDELEWGDRDREERDLQDIWVAHGQPRERVALFLDIEEWPSMKSDYWYRLISYAWANNWDEER
jgi:hypothetical protein